MAETYFAGLGDYHPQNPVEYKKDIVWSHKSSLYQICGSRGIILGNLIMYLLAHSAHKSDLFFKYDLVQI